MPKTLVIVESPASTNRSFGESVLAESAAWRTRQSKSVNSNPWSRSCRWTASAHQRVLNTVVASVSFRENSPTSRSAHHEPAATRQPATATIAATQNGVKSSDSCRRRPTKTKTRDNRCRLGSEKET